jgi:2-oxoglutarate ferredoxin oxidoreductase subunit alpha
MSGINDFAFKMATVNGTGSASANSLLMQAIFRMGIPVTGKNIFPSNIQGLPTFYEVRVSKDGYTARPQYVDLVVALNPATYAKDVATVRPGGYLVYDSSWPLDKELEREGITIIGIPFGQMCVDTFVGDRDRTLLRNIVYAGALAALREAGVDTVPGTGVKILSERVRALVIIWIGTYCARKRNDPMYCAHEILPFPHWRKA